MSQLLQAFSLFSFVILIIQASPYDQSIQDTEESARDLMQKLDVELNERQNKLTEASWAYASNITDYNLKNYNDKSTEHAKFLKVNVHELGIGTIIGKKVTQFCIPKVHQP